MDLSSRKEVGRLGEAIAAKYLESRGFKIIDRNYRKPWGELDLIGLKEGTLRFIEVKAALGGEKGSGYLLAEKVHPQKLKRMYRAIESYLSEKGTDEEWGIDVVTVLLNESNKSATCELIENVL